MITEYACNSLISTAKEVCVKEWWFKMTPLERVWVSITQAEPTHTIALILLAMFLISIIMIIIQSSRS